jgi:Mannosyl-glycoprotein endo-beta-N-acetylglucosaminidase
MHRQIGGYLLFVYSVTTAAMVLAAEMPEIKSSAHNSVPACATPGRLSAYLISRSSEIDPRFAGIATEYMRQGEQLGVRWDYAFFQMIIETGSLSFKRGHRMGDVKPSQNNFAGLGATGGGTPGESFKDVATGVRAHLQHLLLYAGYPVADPVAERTRKVDEWGVLKSWQKGFKRSITYADMTRKWAPGDRSYSSMLAAVAKKFYDDFCTQPDPKPDLVAEARGARPVAAEAKPTQNVAGHVSGSDLAKKAIEDGITQGGEQRSGLGAHAEKFSTRNSAEPNDSEEEEPALARGGLSQTESKPDAKAKLVATTSGGASQTPRVGNNEKSSVQTAAAVGAGVAKSLPIASPKCRVWTASYGGQKAIIIKSMSNQMINFTVLDVNEGAEAREADAFIAAYAKGGIVAGEFPSQSQALDKAFELCPE